MKIFFFKKKTDFNYHVQVNYIMLIKPCYLNCAALTSIPSYCMARKLVTDSVRALVMGILL